jgi:hypothetical protein
MANFKHHSNFTKERDRQRYLFPFVCFGCRKSFRKPHSQHVHLCPECAKPMIMLGRKFHAPKRSELRQWRKVQFLVEHGFLFQSVYKLSLSGGQQTVPYPRTRREAIEFVQIYRDQAVSSSPSAWRTPRTAVMGYIK